MGLFDLLLWGAIGWAGLRLWQGTGSPTTRGLMLASLALIAALVI